MAQPVAQYGLSSSTTLKTLARGQALRGGRHGASSGTTSSGWLTRRRRDQGRVPHEVPMMQAMTIKARRAPARAVSLFPLWCKGGKCRREVPRHQAKVSISVTRPRLAERQDRGHRGAQDGVITRTFGSRRPPLVRIAYTSCPLSKWPLLDPFPLNIWEEDQGLYI